MSKSLLKKIIILVSILALPGFLYYLLQEKGQNRYRPLPVFGPKKLSGTFHSKRGKQIPDTLYHTINSFNLVNQKGDTVNFPGDTPRITVVNFFYSKCGAPCIKQGNEFRRVVERFKDNRLMSFLSISVDPHETPASLSQYADNLNTSTEKWNFVAGDSEEVYKIAKEGFLVDAFADTTGANNFIYSPLFVLVDPQRRIRGFYDSSSKEQVDKLMDEVKVLIAEELRKVADR